MRPWEITSSTNVVCRNEPHGTPAILLLNSLLGVFSVLYRQQGEQHTSSSSITATTTDRPRDIICQRRSAAAMLSHQTNLPTDPVPTAVAKPGPHRKRKQKQKQIKTTERISLFVPRYILEHGFVRPSQLPDDGVLPPLLLCHGCIHTQQRRRH